MEIVGKLWQRAMQIRHGLVALSLLLTIFNLPPKIEKLPEALRWWGTIMPSRETLFIIFSAMLVAWIFWIDLRPSVYSWLRDRDAGDVSIRDAIRWIEKNAAWWRWQIALGGLGADEWSNYNQVAAQLWDQARDGKLTITARQSNEIRRENITVDFWQIGTLQVNRDAKTLWKAIIQPCGGISDQIKMQVEQLAYVDPAIKWRELRKLWPESDWHMDRETKKLLKRKAKKAQ